MAKGQEKGRDKGKEKGKPKLTTKEKQAKKKEKAKSKGEQFFNFKRAALSQLAHSSVVEFLIKADSTFTPEICSTSATVVLYFCQSSLEETV